MKSSSPGRSRQRLTARARRRSSIVRECSTPLLPRNLSRTRRSPSTLTCRARNVVNPNDLLSRAYVSLPTRTRVVSSIRTTVASTLSRDISGFEKSVSTRSRKRGNAFAKAIVDSYLFASRTSRQRLWNGTAYAPSHRVRWPGRGRAGADKSRRVRKRAGSQGSESAPALFQSVIALPWASK